MKDTFHDTKVAASLAPAVQAATLKGSAVDLQGFGSALMVVTTGDVNDIAFTLFLGVLTGTFSSLFIACPVFFWWHRGDRKRVTDHKDIAPTYEWEGASKASR